MGFAFNPFTGKFDYFRTDAEIQAAAVSDAAYDATSWNGVTAVAPSKNAVRDELVSHYATADEHHARYTDAEARAVSIENIVEDTTPQLGGNLDCNNNKIINIVSLGILGWTNVSISIGVINATAIFLALEPETGTSDDLDTLTHWSGVDIVFIRPKDSGDSITVKNETDNINLKGGADITLGDEDECLCLIYDNVNSNWLDVGAGIVAHDIGGASHNADTWANLKGKISDITNVTAAELEYVNGVTAAIQGQIDDNKILAFLGVK